jgi:hypothetical protein
MFLCDILWYFVCVAAVPYVMLPNTTTSPRPPSLPAPTGGGGGSLLLAPGVGDMEVGAVVEAGALFRCSCEPAEEECDLGKDYCQTHTKVWPCKHTLHKTSILCCIRPIVMGAWLATRILK